MPEIAVLVSLGRHPVSGRPRRAPLDARAVELGLGLAGPALRVIHAGDPKAPALRDYLGMGLERLTVLALPAEADPLPALAGHLAEQPPDILLTGQLAESGEDSGLLPYLLAERLGWPVVGQVAEISIDGGRGRVLQGLPRGRRRALAVPLPFVAAVGGAAPAPRQSAYGPARRGRIEVIEAEKIVDQARQSWTWQPARPRPKRLKVVKGASAAERLAAATTTASGGGQVLSGLSAEQAAEQIYAYLAEEGLLTRSRSQ